MTKNEEDPSDAAAAEGTQTKAKWWPRPLTHAIGTVVFGAAVWATFTYLITDPEMALSYLQVLAWPSVVVGATYWLREPLREKLRQVLKVQAPGFNVDFSPESQSRQLDEALHAPLATLAPLVGSRKPSAADADADESGDEEASGDDQVSNVEATDRPGLNGAPTPGGTGEALGSDDVAAAAAPQVVLAIERSKDQVQKARINDLRAIGMALGRSMSGMDQLVAQEGFDPDRVLERLQRSIRIQRASRRRDARARQADTRDSIETVIRNSAAWGYKMGRAGAPEAVPDIAWDDDGNWRITTTVPTSDLSSRSLKEYRDRDAATQDSQRQIRSLEDEIKQIERQQARSAMGNVARMMDDPWLASLKARLRRIDPNNPWAASARP